MLGDCLTSQPLLRASYQVSLTTTKATALHAAGEKLIKPSAVKMAPILLGRNETKRIDSVPLSDDIVNNRIADIANDILSGLSLKSKIAHVEYVFNLMKQRISIQ